MSMLTKKRKDFIQQGYEMFDVNRFLGLKMNGASFEYREPRGVLSIKGKDARDFLQRMSTNDVSKLSKTSPIETCFINNKGRMVDHCLIFQKGEDDFVLVSSHPHGDVLKSWLLQFQFVEDFELIDLSHDLPFTMVIADSLSLNHEMWIKCFQHKLNNGHILNFFGILGEVAVNTVPITEDEWQTLRISALMPAVPNEINDTFMPQNINLDAFIALDKGCYIGQEVIAKALTYQKNKKVLGGAVLTPILFEAPKKGLIEDSLGRRARITSLAPLYFEGEINALAVVDLNPRSLDTETNIIKCDTAFQLKNKSFEDTL